MNICNQQTYTGEITFTIGYWRYLQCTISSVNGFVGERVAPLSISWDKYWVGDHLYVEIEQ